MIYVDRFLPGELEGNVDPTQFGFDVVEVGSPTDEEEATRVRRFYISAKKRTGVVIPTLERYLRSGAGRRRWTLRRR